MCASPSAEVLFGSVVGSFMDFVFFFLNDTPTTEIYPLPLHDALPISARAVIGHTPGLLLCPLDVTVRMRPSAADLEALVDAAPVLGPMLDDWRARQRAGVTEDEVAVRDRKSTRLRSSHDQISYAVFCF